MRLSLIILASYLVGCFPSAYFAVKIFGGRSADIRLLGTGKVGTANTLDVLEGRRLPALLVLLADLAKGMLAVWIGVHFGGGNLLAVPAVAIFCELGHNKNIFLSWRGGRGLAVSAGALILINPLPVGVWIAAWCCGLAIGLDMDRKNLIASAVCIIAMFVIPGAFIVKFATYAVLSVLSVQITCAVLNSIAMLSYLKKIE